MNVLEEQIGQGLCNILQRLWTANQNEENLVQDHTIDGTPVRKLFVSNLAQRTTHKDLEKLFSTYGKLDACYLKRNVSRSNYAFVTFNTVEDAVKAMNEAFKKKIHLHNRDLRVLAADSWHQPDSIENLMKKRPNPAKQNGSKPGENTAPAFVINDDSDIHKLNDDCLMHIFTFLPIADRVRIERVCKRWQSVGHASWRYFKSIDLRPATWGFSQTDEEVNTPCLRKVLLRCGSFLNSLEFSLTRHALSKSTLTVVGRLCPNLQTVNITGLHVSPSGIKALTDNCSNIVKFSLGRSSSACDVDLAKLFAKNSKLRYLKIVTNVITGKCLLSLPKDSIETIILEDCSYITSNHLLSSLPELKNLTTLKVNSCVTCDELTAKAISSCLNLRILHMQDYFPMIRLVGMKFIAELRNLEVLNLAKNVLVADNLLKAVSLECKKLVSININDCSCVTNVGLSAIAGLPKLENLHINGLNKITDEAISDIPSLKYLECRGCGMLKDKGLAHLIEMSHGLAYLDVSNCRGVTNDLITRAIKSTKARTNNVVLKMYVGRTEVIYDEIKEVSPFLQVINVDLSIIRSFNYLSPEPYYIDDFELLASDESNYDIDDDYEYEHDEDNYPYEYNSDDEDMDHFFY